MNLTKSVGVWRLHDSDMTRLSILKKIPQFLVIYKLVTFVVFQQETGLGVAYLIINKAQASKRSDKRLELFRYEVILYKLIFFIFPELPEFKSGEVFITLNIKAPFYTLRCISRELPSGVEKWSSRNAYNVKNTGSNPVSATIPSPNLDFFRLKFLLIKIFVLCLNY